MQRLLLVSNRLPVTIEKRRETLNFRPSVGGVATGLSSFYQTYNSIWIGWCGLSSDSLTCQSKQEIESKLLSEHGSYPTFLSKKDVKMFYSGFCNKTIWPLFHYFSDYAVYGNELWESYKHVNRIFGHTIMKIIEPDDIIWIHDYHLMLLPKLLREKLPHAQIGFFLHIPFPSYEIFRLLPWRKDILEGLLGADLIGFHTYNYVSYFTNSIRRLLGYEHTFGQIHVDHRIIKVDAFPMGIDYHRFANSKANPEWLKEIQRNCKIGNQQRIILSVDRMDYTKGIPQRLEAFDRFLEKYPEYKNCVTLVLVAVPSRTGVETYRLLKKYVDELVGRINGKHGTIGWMPVWYLYRLLSFERLVSLYSIADVALITPLRDGMNLIAKEYIATKKDCRGVLVLSEMAGAVSELAEAVIVNPNNREEVADALKEALTMSEEEQIERNQFMKDRLQRYDVVAWARDFMDRLSHTRKLQNEIATKRLTKNTRTELIDRYLTSHHRLIFLDYDGTLVPFAKKPEKAKPDNEMIELLQMLIRNHQNELVIISGRDKNTLEDWFGHLNVGMSAEHGVWIREKQGEWHMLELLQDDWKAQIRPVMEQYVDRTPGSFIEEKSFSLVWHYRKADPELGPMRAIELKDTLLGLTADLNLLVAEGSKVIEVKNGEVNKGRAALFWTSSNMWDFILAMGDDWTDEDLFEVLPESAYSIKVGHGASKARFYLTNQLEVRELLKTLGNTKNGD